MDNINKYIERFKKGRKLNVRYSIRGTELFAIVDEVKKEPFRALVSLFEYGYAKGYRAALAEMKKKGGAA